MSMTPVARLLAAEIASGGPIQFRRFMEAALYHPEYGYYRNQRDPFGKGGDFFTAEQVQPVFGILIAALVRRLNERMGGPEDFTVVELGAGRKEMAEAFGAWRYLPIDIAGGELPRCFRGVVFSNEFFDALPVNAAIYEQGSFRERRVAFRDGCFQWETAGACDSEAEEYLRRYFPAPDEGRVYEVNLDALRWMERIARSIEAGVVVTVDYGYTRAESVRFPAGTLMGYRRHMAHEDVFREPGLRDITAHVNFTALEEHAAALGLVPERFETLASALLSAGEPDRFAAAIGPGSEAEQLRRRMQLKTLLFGMGETYRVLWQRKAG